MKIYYELITLHIGNVVSSRIYPCEHQEKPASTKCSDGIETCYREYFETYDEAEKKRATYLK